MKRSDKPRPLRSQATQSAAVAAVFILTIGAAFAVQRFGQASDAPVRDTAAGTTAATTTRAQGMVVHPDSHVLGKPGARKVTFVEFLDFECEACGAAYPAIEDLRNQYGSRVTFVARYFPLPGHFNAMRAARAVEAAARQGRFEDMYHRMYTTQPQWAEQRAPKDDLFLSFADDLDLDLVRFNRDYTSQATTRRIKADMADGAALGVDSTPTFFVNEKRLNPTSYTDLTGALDAALADAS